MCNLCGGNLEPLGTLGHLDYYRCRNCGMEFGFNTDEENLYHLDDD